MCNVQLTIQRLSVLAVKKQRANSIGFSTAELRRDTAKFRREFP